jgi:ubiquinone/menaquinone biosynthesis C-methylase UbiE
MKKAVKKYSLKQIREYWLQQALKHGESYSASWSDRMVIDMEIREVIKYLSDGDRVLDVGCANGYSTVQLAAEKRISIRGVDYADEMIVKARSRLKECRDKLLGKVDFHVGDITDLDEPRDAYDKVIVIRVLINLQNRRRQLKGLRECIRVLKPGGILLFSEATLQGWRQLNKFRKEWGLSNIPMPKFNQYLDQEKIIEEVSPHLQLVKVVDFSSTYYVGTRVLKPLLIKALGIDIDVAKPDMEWNRWFSQLPSWGDYGTQKLFVFKKD